MIIRYGQKEKKLDSSLIIIVISCICCLIQLYALPRQLSGFVSLTNRVLLLLWVAFVSLKIILRLRRPIPRKLSSFPILIAISLVAYVLAVVADSSQIVANLFRVFGFLALPLMLLYSMLFEIDKQAKTIVIIFYMLASLILISLYFSDYRYLYQNEYGIHDAEFVTLGYDNPNKAAMYLLLCVSGLIIATFYLKPLIAKAFLLADAAFLTWVMIRTDSRTTILLLTLFLVLSMLIKKLSIKWIWVFMIVPLVYVLLPVLFPQSLSLTFMGDFLYTGRERIFAQYYAQLNAYTAFVGDMNLFTFQNLHNGYIAIAASVGIPACLTFICSMKNFLTWSFPAPGSALYERMAFIAVLCLYLNTSVEAAFFVGGSTFAFLLFSPMILFVKPYNQDKLASPEVNQ